MWILIWSEYVRSVFGRTRGVTTCFSQCSRKFAVVCFSLTIGMPSLRSTGGYGTIPVGIDNFPT